MDNYSLPRPHLIARPLVNGQNAVSNAGSGPSGTYMGQDFRAAYVPDSSLNGAGQIVGLLQFDGYTASDIAYYESQAGLPSIMLSNVLLDGFSGNPTGDGGEVEVSLDIEMAISMATNLSQVVVYEAGPDGSWHDILNRMATDNLAKQLSCSWYIPGGGSDPVADQIWQEMAAQGQSFFNASGDDDAYTGLIPFPGDTPYITQVGGTTLTTSGPGGAWVSETVWNWGDGIGSGGGISTQYPIPIWQTNISMTANQGSTTMRNTPDVALTADNVYVRADGDDYNVGGTSCAAPLWAGFAALVNQQATSSGSPLIGFINPALDTIGTGANYASVFHDITTGNNESSASPTKFSAVAGYDLCTGWGTPAGQNLINALANPEALLITPPSGFTSTGGFGGPFTITSQNFLLTNSGTNSLTWTLANTSSWLTASSTSGTLAPGGSAATVTMSLNYNASNLVVGTYSATVWFTNLNDKIGQSRQFNLSVISPPTITTQPANQAVLQGAAAMFTVAATGGLPLSYQWNFKGTNLTDGGGIAGSATTNLIVSSVSAANVGIYTVVVTNLAGIITSSNALLTITPSPPVIIVQPASHGAVAGSTVTLTVTAIGTTPFSYQWSFNGTNLADGGGIAGSATSTLTLADVQLTQAGNYAVLVTNVLGSVYSSNATLNVFYIPVITSISPGLGVVGTVASITGLNFSPVPGSNTVYFGAVAAEVTAASATNLTAMVPAGATFAPVTETVNGLTAYADQPFMPAFPGSGQINSSSLAPLLNLPTANGPIHAVIADLDGDGKPDLIVSEIYAAEISIYRNISTNGSLTAGSFAPRVDLPLPPGSGNDGYAVVAADVDGDGRLDIVVLNVDSNLVSIFRNIGSSGSITTNSFAARIDLPADSNMRGLAVQDLNGDGKPELVTANANSSGSISIFQNLSTPGNIAFAARVDLPVDNTPTTLAIGDLDGDGHPDVAVANYNSGTISVFRNTGVGGNITTNSFAPKVDLPALTAINYMAIGDMDGDGKLDLVTAAGNGSQKISVYRNTATAGSITTNSFAPHVDFATPGWANSVALADLGGNGKLDIAVASQLSSVFSIFQNVSTPGSFTTASLAPRVDYTAGYNPSGIAIGDLDGDGRPDIIFGNTYDNTLTIYRNIVPFGSPPVINPQPTNQTVFVGGTAVFSVTASGTLPLSYQWSLNATNLVGATNATLTLTNVQPAQAGDYAVLVTNTYGAAFSSNALLTVIAIPPAITSQPTNQTVTVGGTAIFQVTASGTAPLSYQWTFNGTNFIVGATNVTLTLTNVQLIQAGSYAVQATNIAGVAVSSNAVLTVNDKLDHFVWGQIPSPRFLDTPFTVVIQAQDATNGLFTNFNSSVILSSTNGISINPSSSAAFVQGVWTGAVTIAQTATNLVLQASDGQGDSGLANPVSIVNLPPLTTVASGSTLYVFWPVNPSGFALETTDGLSPASWVPVTIAPFQIGDQYLVPIEMSETNAFYRLIFSGP